MSQPRRRRRRGRRRGGSGDGSTQQNRQAQPPAGTGRSAAARRRRRRRKPGRPNSPVSSEDLVRAPAKERPATLMLPPDGTTLEQLIGELQSNWGVPQSPQEFRLIVKVSEERERGDSGASNDSNGAERTTEGPRERDPDRPKREKAPSAPRISSGGGSEQGSRRKRRRRRGGRGRGPRPAQSLERPNPTVASIEEPADTSPPDGTPRSEDPGTAD